MPPSQVDPWDRRVLLVGDRGDGETFRALHKQRGATAEADDDVLPAGVLADDGTWQAMTLGPGGGVLVEDVGGGSGGASQVDNSAFALDTDRFTPTGGVFDDAAPALASGQAATVRITPARAIHMSMRDQDGVELGTTSDPVQTGSPDGAHTAIGATTDAAVTTNTTGTISGKLRGIVAILASVWQSAVNALRVGGDTAHDAADGATLPVKIGGRAIAGGAFTVASGDRTDCAFTINGNPLVAKSYAASGHTITTTGSATAQDHRPRVCSKWALQVSGFNVAATAWTVNLQVSLDGGNWTTILTHRETDGDGVVLFIADRPAIRFRVNTSALTLGGAIGLNVTVVGE